MTRNKMATLVLRVLAKTRKGALKWEETNIKEVYQASFPNYSIQIYTRSGDEPENDYVLGIYDQEGTLIDEIADPELNQYITENAFFEMRELYQTARRIALGAEDVIDELLAELGDDGDNDLGEPDTAETEIPF